MQNPQNKTFLSIVIVLLFVLGLFFIISRGITKQTTVAPTPTPTTPGLQKFTDVNTGITFDFPEKLPSTYIRAVDWPPAVQLVNEKFSCNPAGDINTQAGKTENLVVNGHTYCLTRESEGAAGSIYTNYAYAFANDVNTIILTFSLQAVQCDNYPDPEKTACETERNTFTVDNIVDAIAQSIEFQ